MTSLENEEAGIVERINPLSVPQGILSVHLARYEFAAQFARARSTLDIACGAGYGSHFLSENASFVVGGDADQGAIDFAIRNYSAPNLRFARVDALNMPFEGESFECVVSFETIEHLSDIDRFLSEVTRIIARDGIFVVSTPLVAITNHRPVNPHHTIEYSAPDFSALLGRYFDSVALYGQSRVQTSSHRWLQRLDVFGIRHRIPAFVRRRATRALGTVPYEDMGTGNQQIRLNDLEHAHDMVAVCTSSRRNT